MAYNCWYKTPWIFNILSEFHIPTSSFLANSISQIDYYRNLACRLYTTGVTFGLLLKYVSVVYNNIVQWTLLPTNSLCILNFPPYYWHFSHKYVSCLFQWWNLCPWYEINWSLAQSLQSIIKLVFSCNLLLCLLLYFLHLLIILKSNVPVTFLYQN